MTKATQDLKKLKPKIVRILKKHGIKKAGIFGSYARGEQKKNSELDILVEFEEAPGLFKFLELEERLKTILKVKVDLVMKSALKPRIGKRILSEVVYA